MLIELVDFDGHKIIFRVLYSGSKNDLKGLKINIKLIYKLASCPQPAQVCSPGKRTTPSQPNKIHYNKSSY